jgi:hypothetical protein
MHEEEKLKGKGALKFFPELTIYICTDIFSISVNFLPF